MYFLTISTIIMKTDFENSHNLWYCVTIPVVLFFHTKMKTFVTINLLFMLLMMEQYEVCIDADLLSFWSLM